MMTNQLRIILPLLLCTITMRSSIAQDSEWKLRRDKVGIKVYTRSSENSSFDEFKGVLLVEAMPEQIISVLQDADNMDEWLPDCEKSKLHSLEGNDQYHYTVSGAPFPVQDRDSYVHFEYIEIENGYRVKMQAVPDYGPEKEDMVRIRKADGFWLVQRLNKEQSEVTYQLLADPGGAIPGWLANAAVVDTPFETLQNLRERLE